MKLRAFKPFAMACLGLCVAVSLATAAVRAGDETPTPAPTATLKGKKSKQAKDRKDTADPTLPPKVKKPKGPKDIPFPIPEGKPAHDVTIPSYNEKGDLTSLIKALVMTPIDKEHVQMEGTKFNLYSPDGKDNYEIELPRSILNLKTNVVTSEQPVTVRTKDFELTGEKMQFDTVERNGELQGHVHMRIHNMKQLSTPGIDTPATK